jgi:hypothetical protein
VASPVPAKLRELVLERDEYRCVRCGCSIVGQRYSLQHRKARQMGGRKGAHTAANLVVLCGSATTGCHQIVESEREYAQRQGYAVPSWGDPEKLPVWRHGFGWQLPSEDGWISCDEA